MPTNDIWRENLEIRTRILLLTSQELQRNCEALEKAEEDCGDTGVLALYFDALRYLSVGLSGVAADPSLLDAGKDFLTHLYITGTGASPCRFTPEQNVFLERYEDFLVRRAEEAQKTGSFNPEPPTVAQSLCAAEAFLKSAIENLDECLPAQEFLYALPVGTTEEQMRDVFGKILRELAEKFQLLLSEMKSEHAQKELSAAAQQAMQSTPDPAPAQAKQRGALKKAGQT